MSDPSGSFTELPNGAVLTDNQAAAALANVAVYCDAFAVQIATKARERGVEPDDAFAVAALEHIVEVTSRAAIEWARPIGDEVRQTAFAQGIPAAYHIMSGAQALEVEGTMREMALAGAIPSTGGI